MVNPIEIDGEIDKYGSKVTLVKKSDVEFDDWGNEYYDEDGTETIAVPNDITGGEEFNVEGVFIPGDKVFFFKSTQTGLENGGLIKFNSQSYRIVQIVSHNIQDTQHQYEVRCKRV